MLLFLMTDLGLLDGLAGGGECGELRGRADHDARQTGRTAAPQSAHAVSGVDGAQRRPHALVRVLVTDADRRTLGLQVCLHL